MPLKYRPEGCLYTCRAPRRTCREQVNEEQSAAVTKNRAGRAPCTASAEICLVSKKNAGKIICQIQHLEKFLNIAIFQIYGL